MFNEEKFWIGTLGPLFKENHFQSDVAGEMFIYTFTEFLNKNGIFVDRKDKLPKILSEKFLKGFDIPVVFSDGKKAFVRAEKTEDKSKPPKIYIFEEGDRVTQFEYFASDEVKGLINGGVKVSDLMRMSATPGISVCERKIEMFDSGLVGSQKYHSTIDFDFYTEETLADIGIDFSIFQTTPFFELPEGTTSLPTFSINFVEIVQKEIENNFSDSDLPNSNLPEEMPRVEKDAGIEKISKYISESIAQGNALFAGYVQDVIALGQNVIR